MTRYISCSCGHEHWGEHGAAGLLLTNPERTGVVLQHRSGDVHQGNTWGVPGGAVEPGEDVVAAALREACEEAQIDEGVVDLLQVVPGTVHPEWSYTYVVAELPRSDDDVLPGESWEAHQTRWVDLDQVGSLPLHPGFADDWPSLRKVLQARAPAEE
jgi:8-oxo-dGTP diphosphatase